MHYLHIWRHAFDRPIFKKQNKTIQKQKNKKQQQQQQQKQILLSEPGLEFSFVCILFTRPKWLKLWAHALAAVLVAHSRRQSLLVQDEGVWLRRDVKIPARAMAEKTKHLLYFLFLLSPPFFFLKYRFFVLFCFALFLFCFFFQTQKITCGFWKNVIAKI